MQAHSWPGHCTAQTTPSIAADGISTYPGLGFGPMGPVAPLPGEPPGTQLRQKQETTTDTSVTEEPKKARTLVIAAFEFHRDFT
ncbi:unnamed protein product [Leptidea sinapis]|uniref:Uncharacterized protein n=1 Tax=Leptidea sinapis TaxID=189913 RepID=A0A5E4QYD5_9NEOP|nr:unnamed protein product [Leptidea sinapis]